MLYVAAAVTPQILYYSIMQTVDMYSSIFLCFCIFNISHSSENSLQLQSDSRPHTYMLPLMEIRQVDLAVGVDVLASFDHHCTGRFDKTYGRVVGIRVQQPEAHRNVVDIAFRKNKRHVITFVSFFFFVLISTLPSRHSTLEEHFLKVFILFSSAIWTSTWSKHQNEHVLLKCTF